MSPVTQQAIDMLEMLPEEEQLFAAEMIKRIVLAWDPDFTKVTPAEKARMDKAEQEVLNGEYLTEEEFWEDTEQ